ncbi:magnesium transporter [Gudongella sp. SC589]|uniref:magnesium transporter n=1 Tax=Gudongella sp. SC589 TaxID=3385990 RepID=UPI0039049603
MDELKTIDEILEEILDLIEEKKYVQIKKTLQELNEVDIADVLDELDLHDTLLIFRMLPKDLAVDVFAHFEHDRQLEIIEAITDKEVKNIVEELFFDDMIDLIEEMPANIVKKVLKHSTEEERKLINQFLMYPQESAGSIMTIEYVDLKKQMTVGEALKHIKETGITKETVYTCYVTDQNRKLEGIVSLRLLVVSDKEAVIEDLMEDDIIYANTHDDQESVAGLFRKYGFLAIPVVDNEKRLTGIITVDDIMEVMEQEATEDFQRMAAMAPSEEAYLNTKVMVLAKQRILWLLILMVSATISGNIISRYEDILSAVVVLTSFVPMLMDTGGNSGSQSSTLIIRGLATGEIQMKDAPKVLWKEFRIALMVGGALAAVNFLRLLFIVRTDYLIGILVSLTLMFTVVIAKLLGGMLPIAAKKLKLDPAIMAGPLITTIADALSLIVYFSMASILLGI